MSSSNGHCCSAAHLCIDKSQHVWLPASGEHSKWHVDQLILPHCTKLTKSVATGSHVKPNVSFCQHMNVTCYRRVAASARLTLLLYVSAGSLSPPFNLGLCCLRSCAPHTGRTVMFSSAAAEQRRKHAPISYKPPERRTSPDVKPENPAAEAGEGSTADRKESAPRSGLEQQTSGLDRSVSRTESGHKLSVFERLRR